MTSARDTESIRDGRYPTTLLKSGWGDVHNVPHKCYVPIVSRNGIPCQTFPTWHFKGTWTCGSHKPRSGVLSSEHVLPPVPPPPFEPFECMICFESCASEKKAYITSCNHKFHKTCMSKWTKHKYGPLTCPTCRDIIVSHPFYKEQWKVVSDHTLVQLGGEYSRIIHRYGVTVCEWKLMMDVLKLLVDHIEALDTETVRAKANEKFNNFPTKERRIDFVRRMKRLYEDVTDAINDGHLGLGVFD